MKNNKTNFDYLVASAKKHNVSAKSDNDYDCDFINQNQTVQQKDNAFLDKEFVLDLIAELHDDYFKRREERRHFESQWQLNSNFLSGNQYCAAGISGKIVDCDKDYYWQEREVFNHIAFIVETRLAKLNRVRPHLSVRPSSLDENDVKAANVSTKILTSTSQKLNLNDILMKGTQWAETAGSVFYKVSWDKNLGKKVGYLNGNAVCEGEVRIDICPPYEIFPDNISSQDINDCNSIIHAKAVHVDDIFKSFNKIVQPEDVDTVAFLDAGKVGGLGVSSIAAKRGRKKSDGYAVVIERYTAPSPKCPNGELVIVSGNQLLFYGDLPFKCGADGEYSLPFIKQDSIVNVGCFFGTSMIERAIPIQRAYNAVKNRKHEFLNRLAMGVLAVEDGSVDIENLETEGLSPGKILVYRQGSTPPSLLDAGSVPNDLNAEEEKLLNEFIMISGVSEVMRSSNVSSSLTSAAALELLLEQDDTRLSATAERIRIAAKQIATFILRLYKQFAAYPRLSRCVGTEGDIQLVGWNNSDLSSDDVILDTENELSDSLSSRRGFLLQLLKSGVLSDENGNLSAAVKSKILDALGFGFLEGYKDETRLNTLKAQRENAALLNAGKADKQVLQHASEIDDHNIHISEHKRFMLSIEYEKLCKLKGNLNSLMLEHIKSHRALLDEEKTQNQFKDKPLSDKTNMPNSLIMQINKEKINERA